MPEESKPEYSHGTILPKAVEQEMQASYLDYAMSVIVGRALPDVRDGLKPVHRRILYAMYELSNTHDKPYKKSARVVGETLGKYHPHGDVAIYDSLVRMAQDFSLRYTLVDGQGNWGSIDGDNAAAMRYTEVRMSKLAEEMLSDIEKETVPFAPNFDGTLKEPLVLPSKLPNLLINGSSGIAVGMATNIPPHNLGEIVDGLVALIDNPILPLQQLMELIKGPDFPTGGTILGKRGITEGYATGKGIMRIRGTATMQEPKSEKAKRRIIITEIPYQVNKSQLILHIAELVRDKKIEGISDIKDSSDRAGMLIIIDLKKDANSEVVLNQLYANTQLEVTFGINNLALVNNEPKTLSLPQTLQEFIKHRQTVVRKRSQFELAQAEERSHILEGLKVALDNIDAVVKAIKAAPNPQSAKSQLISLYSLSEKQSAAILEMKLSRLTALEHEKLLSELGELASQIKWLKEVLADEKKIFEIIKKELFELKNSYADERKTRIEDTHEEIEIEDLIPKEQVAIIITESNYIKRMPISEYKSQRRGGKGIIGTGTREEDVVKGIIIASTHDYLLVFTESGMVHWLKAYKVPESGRYAMGKAIVNLLSIENDKVAACIPVPEFKGGEYLLMATKNGIVKRSDLLDYSRPRAGGIIAITLKEKDSLIEVLKTQGKHDIILATREGQAIRFPEEDIREIGRTGQGVIGIRMREGDGLVAMALNDAPTLLTICENGYGKRTELSEYRAQGRGGLGMINIQADERNGKVVDALTVKDSDEIIVISSRGKVIRIPVNNISTIGRNTKGVRIMRLEEGEKVVAVERVPPSTAENGDVGATQAN